MTNVAQWLGDLVRLQSKCATSHLILRRRGESSSAEWGERIMAEVSGSGPGTH